MNNLPFYLVRAVVACFWLAVALVLLPLALLGLLIPERTYDVEGINQ